jgi:hypothetical protein
VVFIENVIKICLKIYLIVVFINYIKKRIVCKNAHKVYIKHLFVFITLQKERKRDDEKRIHHYNSE